MISKYIFHVWESWQALLGGGVVASCQLLITAQGLLVALGWHGHCADWPSRLPIRMNTNQNKVQKIETPAAGLCSLNLASHTSYLLNESHNLITHCCWSYFLTSTNICYTTRLQDVDTV